MAYSLDGLRFLVGFFLLAYASIRDWRTRRIENSVWWFGGALGLLLLVPDALLTQRVGPADLAIALLVIGTAYVLWYVHLLAGGADAKALMMLAVLLPGPIEWDWGVRVLPLWPSPFPPALVVLTNGVLFLVAAPVAFLLLNAARGDVRFPAMLLGHRMPLSQARKRHVWIVERVGPGGKVEQILWASRLTKKEQAAHAAQLARRGVRRVWTTPKIPFMIPLLAGFVAAFVAGDVLTHFVVEPLVGFFL